MSSNGIEHKSELINQVKKHVTQNGSVTASMYFANVSDPDTINQYYNPQTQGYCNLNKKTTNHRVSIIGWDDNYSKENFPKENRPQNNGAFLINIYWKYFNIVYISYEDIGVLTNLQGVLNCE